MNRKVLLIGATGITLALGLAACSSKKSTSSAPTTSAPAASASTSCTGDINVGRSVDGCIVGTRAEQCRKRPDHRQPAHTRGAAGVPDPS